MSTDTLSLPVLLSNFSETEKAEAEQNGFPPTHRRECDKEHIFTVGDR